jgi:hypothetical protein
MTYGSGPASAPAHTGPHNWCRHLPAALWNGMEDAAALLLSAGHIVGQTVAVVAEVDGPSLDVAVGVVAGIGRRKKDHRPLTEAAVVGLGSASGWPNLANWARAAAEGVALGTT